MMNQYLFIETEMDRRARKMQEMLTPNFDNFDNTTGKNCEFQIHIDETCIHSQQVFDYHVYSCQYTTVDLIGLHYLHELTHHHSDL